MIFDQFKENRFFIYDALVAKVKFQFGSTLTHRRRFPPRDGTNDDSRLSKVTDNEAILDIKALDLPAGVVVRSFPSVSTPSTSKNRAFTWDAFLIRSFGYFSRTSFTIWISTTVDRYIKGRKLGNPFNFKAITAINLALAVHPE